MRIDKFTQKGQEAILEAQNLEKLEIHLYLDIHQTFLGWMENTMMFLPS